MDHFDFLQVIKNGKYYFPAYEHYLLKGRNRCNFCMDDSSKKYYRIRQAIICEECCNEKKWSVSCDMCKSCEITSCIGWKDNDICLKCICIIDKAMIKKQIQQYPLCINRSKIINELIADLKIGSDKSYKYDYTENDVEWGINIMLDCNNNSLKIIVDKECYASFPCKHKCSVIYFANKKIKKKYFEKQILSMPEIRKILILFTDIMVPMHMTKSR